MNNSNLPVNFTPFPRLAVQFLLSTGGGGWYKEYFHILNRLGVTNKCNRQTDRRTDFTMASAALLYLARPET